MQVPVKIHFDPSTKEYDIEIGTPPTSNLILKEAGIEKGSGIPNADKVADLLIEQIIKIAKMKEDVLSGRTLKEKVKNIIGTCRSMGILIEGKEPAEVIKEVDSGKYDREIQLGKTELSAEEMKKLEEEKKKMAEEVKKKHEEEDKKANQIMESMAGKEKTVIKAKLREAGISESVIIKLTSKLGGPAPAAGGKAAAPAGKAAAPPKK
jgi:large subunit ribosomal protein L11